MRAQKQLWRAVKEEEKKTGKQSELCGHLMCDSGHQLRGSTNLNALLFYQELSKHAILSALPQRKQVLSLIQSKSVHRHRST